MGMALRNPCPPRTAGVSLAIGLPVRRRVRLYGEPVGQADNTILLWTA